MIAVAWWQAILNFLGSVLAALYKVIPNYGVAIILLTLIMRVVLLPLGIKPVLPGRTALTATSFPIRIGQTRNVVVRRARGRGGGFRRARLVAHGGILVS